MKRTYAVCGTILVILTGLISLFFFRADGSDERLRFQREETQLTISNLADAHLTLFRAGHDLSQAVALKSLNEEEDVWLPKGNYFLEVQTSTRTFLYPVPILSYRSGPDKDGAFNVTVRRPPPDAPPSLLSDSDFVYIPAGHFLFGDHLRRQEPHYVWLPAFFIFPFEVTNAEFQKFMTEPAGYSNDANWTEAGRRWKASNPSHVTALLKPTDNEYERFGQPHHPVVQVNWFEANAFCHWLTKTTGRGRWIFGLPTEAEWEKVARGPDNFDYSLSMHVSDNEVGLYNWKKNPGAEITVVGVQDTKSQYRSNRYGAYHMTGNTAEWTQSIYRSYSRAQPYVDDDDRNHDEMPGERVVRGGSWYTASIAVLYIPYRENFRPEVQTPYLGFRVVARPVP